VREDRHDVVSLTSPSRYPPFNGKKERSIRDIRSYERAVRRHTRATTLWDRVAKAIHDLNEQRPRPVLGGRTAREVFAGDPSTLPDRKTFRKEVAETEKTMLGDACSRRGQPAARRKAVEAVLLIALMEPPEIGLMEPVESGCLRGLGDCPI
jgi:hypothetical protein